MQPTIVQEVQGLYGPFSVSEKIIQQIWHRGDFHQENLRTVSGKPLKVLDPGRWNTNEGPDFREARLEIEGAEVVGDVEIHFYRHDWFHHGHDRNPNFDRVVLHVVLYGEADPGPVTELPMETLVLMPLLERDLEDYTMEAALLDLEQVNQLDWFGPFMEKPLPERRALLRELSHERWQQKLRFRKKRLDGMGWSRCCHESALEVLGYARNRGVMHKIAASYTMEDFSGGLDVNQVFEDFRDSWKLSGSRPANHPRLRLQQYGKVCSANPDWPNQLLHLFEDAVPATGELDVAAFRKLARVKELEAAISEEVFRGVIGSKRLSTLLCDAIFPLADAALGKGWGPYWQHWYAGDFPEAFSRFCRQSDLVDTRTPVSNGLMQGILALFLSKGGCVS